MPNIQALNDYFKQFEHDKPVVKLKEAVAELIAEERHCELFLALFEAFEAERDAQTADKNFGIAGDYAHRAAVIRDYFLSG